MIYQVKQREAELRGEARGNAKVKREAALKMIQRGYPIDEISLITGLSPVEISALKAEATN